MVFVQGLVSVSFMLFCSKVLEGSGFSLSKDGTYRLVSSFQMC